MCFIISKKKQTKINALNKLLNNVLLRTSEGQQDDLTSFSTDCKTVPFSDGCGGCLYSHYCTASVGKCSFTNRHISGLPQKSKTNDERDVR